MLFFIPFLPYFRGFMALLRVGSLSGEIKIEIDGSPAPDKIKTQSKRLTYDSE